MLVLNASAASGLIAIVDLDGSIAATTLTPYFMVQKIRLYTTTMNLLYIMVNVSNPSIATTTISVFCFLCIAVALDPDIILAVFILLFITL